MRVVIALGSNLGDRFETLQSAITSLRHQITIIAISSFHETVPVGGPEQPEYLNAVLIGETEMTPLELLHTMQDIENKAQRIRVLRWGPRTLDLDLIMAGNHKIDSEELTVPHPRARDREFVLGPWLEIDPSAQIGGVKIEILLSALRTKG